MERLEIVITWSTCLWSTYCKYDGIAEPRALLLASAIKTAVCVCTRERQGTDRGASSLISSSWGVGGLVKVPNPPASTSESVLKNKNKNKKRKRIVDEITSHHVHGHCYSVQTIWPNYELTFTSKLEKVSFRCMVAFAPIRNPYLQRLRRYDVIQRLRRYDVIQRLRRYDVILTWLA